jgi:light-regulated signal transduction histidine kinase (bacteriophytochrome)
MLRQAWQNLQSNAIQDTRNAQKARIEVVSETHPHEAIFYVKDNGVGFDIAYAGNLFGVGCTTRRCLKARASGLPISAASPNVTRATGAKAPRSFWRCLVRMEEADQTPC